MTSSEIFNDKNIKINSRKFLYVAVCTGNLAAFACGTACGWSSPIIPKLNGAIEPENNPLPRPLTSDEESWIGSLLPIGAIPGSIISGLIVDKIGRKNCLIASTIPIIIAFIMAAFLNYVNSYLIMRFLCGLSIGGVFTVLPIYVGEISDDEVRGSLGSLMQIFIAFGLLFSFIFGAYMPLIIINILCVVVPIIFIPTFSIFIPESPYYLVLKNDTTGAEKSLAKIRCMSREDVQDELLQIQKNVKMAIESKQGFLSIIKSKSLIKALIISVALVFFQQFSGISAILFYTQNIFQATGSTIPPTICSIIIGTVQLVSSFISPALVDRLGKRFLLLFSAIGMTFFEGTLGCFFYLQEHKQNVDSLFWLPVVCLVGYIITYCMGFGGLPFAVMSEIFPTNVKSIAIIFTICVCWVTSFFISRFFGNIINLIGSSGSFWIFTCFCAVAAIFVYKYLPETSGKSFQEIQDILNGNLK